MRWAWAFTSLKARTPRFERPLSSEADIAALEPNKARDELGYVMDAVALIRKELNECR